MDSSHQEEVTCNQEPEFTGPASSKEKKIIYFSSGETMEEDSEEEEEESLSTAPFRETAEKTRISFRKLAFLVGRISLLTCDFLGERLAGALGLNAAKYQYAVDQYQRDHKKPSSKTPGGIMEGRGEMIHLSARQDRSHYGATGEARCSDDNHTNRKDGYHNGSYQADEDCLK
ncbi:hypothetical protein JOB18_036873 [Solea senegalensis]|uniref:Uncharacterized protein n=1 Tax=Solea senegalensis TaxID=28829 RepID=A0AAV6RZL9_SOLSE|nr:protein FAM177A1 [Solea senegalensis]KAG7509191.1 hypothetical protein JOB18_036873 [Solea senegalensis]